MNNTINKTGKIKLNNENPAKAFTPIKMMVESMGSNSPHNQNVYPCAFNFRISIAPAKQRMAPKTPKIKIGICYALHFLVAKGYLYSRSFLQNQASHLACQNQIIFAFRRSFFRY